MWRPEIWKINGAQGEMRTDFSFSKVLLAIHRFFAIRASLARKTEWKSAMADRLILLEDPLPIKDRFFEIDPALIIIFKPFRWVVYLLGYSPTWIRFFIEFHGKDANVYVFRGALLCCLLDNWSHLLWRSITSGSLHLTRKTSGSCRPHHNDSGNKGRPRVRPRSRRTRRKVVGRRIRLRILSGVQCRGLFGDTRAAIWFSKTLLR